MVGCKTCGIWVILDVPPDECRQLYLKKKKKERFDGLSSYEELRLLTIAIRQNK